MKLSELKTLAVPVVESASSEAHQEKIEALEAAIKDELHADDDMVEKIVDYLINNADPEGVQDFLYHAFQEKMPYNVMSDDPSNWISDHMEHLFKDYTKGL